MEDTQVHIYTALTIPTPAPQPSINSVQWSGDGQLILYAKNAVYVLTPDLGINYSDRSIFKADWHDSQAGKSDGLNDLGTLFNWHRNIIELDKIVLHQWPQITQEWGSVVLGSLDVSCRTVTVSPGNLVPQTIGTGCLLVVMNTNLELTLWCTNRNHLKEAWTRMQDITADLRELPLEGEESTPQDRIAYLKTLQAQVQCVAWSPQVNYDVQPDPLIDGSILAMGNRAGSVLLMRFDGKSLGCERILRIADEWITNVAWSPWRSSRPFHCVAYLACGAADGSVIIVKIQQRINPSPKSLGNPFSPNFCPETSTNLLEQPAASADGKGITALSWINVAENVNEPPTLFLAKPGRFHFSQVQEIEPDPVVSITPETDYVQQSSIKELMALSVATQKMSVGSSPFVPVSAVNRVFDPERELLVVTLHDGSFHVIENPCTAPILVNDAKNPSQGGNSVNGDRVCTSASLSRSARAAFTKTEGDAVQVLDVSRTSGATSFDGANTLVWLHERCRPTDFDYKYDAKHNSMLVVAELHRDQHAIEGLMKIIERTLRWPSLVFAYTSIHRLRPILLHLSRRTIIDKIWPQVLNVLSVNLPEEDDSSRSINPCSGPIDNCVREAFRRSLSIDLYGWISFLSLRLRLSVADHCWKMSSNEQMRDQFGSVAQTLLNRISHRFLKVVVRHLLAALKSLSERELPFLMRAIVQGLLPGSPPELTAQAQTLNEAARAKFAEVSPESFGLVELCPACKSPIPLENLLSAVCPMGHVWARCTITSFILSTPMVRTCIGCTRKAFLAPSSRTISGSTVSNDWSGAASIEQPEIASAPLSIIWIPDACNSWVVDELLEAARCCLYCGNRFIRII